MKKLFTNSNPFILLLAPLVFAIIMGVAYQFEQKKVSTDGNSTIQATSLFVKGITLVKTVCSVAKEKVW
jgi:cytochrome c biogenesis protein CcdA